MEACILKSGVVEPTDHYSVRGAKSFLKLVGLISRVQTLHFASYVLSE